MKFSFGAERPAKVYGVVSIAPNGHARVMTPALGFEAEAEAIWNAWRDDPDLLHELRTLAQRPRHQGGLWVRSEDEGDAADLAHSSPGQSRR